MNQLRSLSKVTAVLGIFSLLLVAAPALAGKPQLDNGSQITQQEKPYDSAQTITDIFSNKGVYGKLDSVSSVDIYKFTADKDGEQTFSLLAKGDTTNAPILVLLDPTDATADQALQLPLPGEGYHTALIKAAGANQTYYETALMQKYNLLSEQKIKLKKGSTYYLVAIQPYGQAATYAIKMGEGKAWTAKDFFTDLGPWFRLQTDNYAEGSPLTFSAKTFALLFLFFGIIMLFGSFVFEHMLAFFSIKRPTAGYLLVRLQQYSRFLTWIGLWFTALGAYMHFDRIGWTGLPFLMAISFIVLLVSLLFQTIYLSPKIRTVETNQGEAVLPLTLRKQLTISFAVSAIAILTIMVLLSMYLLTK